MELEKICKKLIIREPFWGLFLLGLNKRYTTQIPTLAVAKAGIGVELWINPAFWESLKDTEQVAILMHELHHICFGHIFMGPDFPDQKRFNIACDAEVNCYIEGLPPDDGHVDVKKLGLPEKQGAKWYYNNLPQNCSSSPSDGNGNGNQNADSGNSSGQGGGVPNLSDDHSTWKQFARATEAQQELVKNQVNGLIRQAAIQTVKQRGTVPCQLKSIIDELLKERPRIYDWKAQFRRMLGTEIDLKLKKTYQRESRRFIGSPGLKFKKKVRILVGIDTSGSVSDTELSEFFSEIMHIHRAGATVHVIECDAAIQNEWEFTGFRNVQITGRGGTDFAPAVDYYREHKKEYTMFVFFTDGEAPIDNLNVPNNDMTWVITSDGARQDYPGKVIYIPSRPKDN